MQQLRPELKESHVIQTPSTKPQNLTQQGTQTNRKRNRLRLQYRSGFKLRERMERPPTKDLETQGSGKIIVIKTGQQRGERITHERVHTNDHRHQNQH